ncbi:MAG: hypothetical protein JNL21_09020 [Myxococcales bacterium]|nr:hypothetical protein [Myxococcales bacterium]
MTPVVRHARSEALRRALSFAVLVAGCSSSTERTAPHSVSSVTSAPAPRRCEEEVTALRTYLETLAKEGEVHAETYPVQPDRYASRRLPAIAFADGGLPPKPAPQLAYVTLDRRTIRYAAESVAVDAAGELAALFRRTAESGQVGGFGSDDFYLQSFVLLVGEKEAWREVVVVVEAARATGFTQVHLLVGAKSAVAAPVPSELGRRLEAMATSDRMPYEREQDLRDALAERAGSCQALRELLPVRVDDTTAREASWKSFVSRAPELVAACNCSIAAADLQAFAWYLQGRHWGPTTSTITLDLGSRRPRDGREAVLDPVGAAANAPFATVLPKLKALPAERAVRLITN